MHCVYVRCTDGRPLEATTQQHQDPLYQTIHTIKTNREQLPAGAEPGAEPEAGPSQAPPLPPRPQNLEDMSHAEQ